MKGQLVRLMRLNKVVIAGCLLVGFPIASFGAKFNQDDLFKTAAPSTSAAGAFANTVGSIKETEKVVQARKLLEIANTKIAQEPNNDRFYLARAQCYRDLGDFSASLADINHAISLKPNTQFYYNFRSAIYANLHDYPAQLKDLDHAIAMGPVNAELLTVRATLHVVTNNYKKAVSDADNALSLNPKYADAYAVRGEARFLLNNRQGAEADCKQGELLDHDNAGIVKLQKLLRKSGP